MTTRASTPHTYGAQRGAMILRAYHGHDAGELAAVLADLASAHLARHGNPDAWRAMAEGALIIAARRQADEVGR